MRDTEDYISTSPSVYVVYEDISALTDCDDTFSTFADGKKYNITAAYDPGGLSTSVCHWGAWLPMNYTEMQYPPANSELPGCVVPGFGSDANPTRDPETIASHPIFSYPDDVIDLKPEWKTCTPGLFGAYDPPRTLNKESSIVAPPTRTSAVPGPTIVPDQPSPTPAPAPKMTQDPQKDPPQPVSSPVNSDPDAQPESNLKPADPQQSDPSSNNTPDDEPSNQNNSPKGGDPSSAGNPQSNNDPPNKDNPSSNSDPSNNNSPGNGDPSNSDPGPNSGSPNNNVNPSSSGKPPSIDSPTKGDPYNGGNPSNGNGDPSNGNGPSNNKPANNVNPSDVEDNPISGNPTSNGNPSNGSPSNGSPTQSRNLGGIIASAFGFGPDSGPKPTAGAPNVPVNNPDVSGSGNTAQGPPASVMVNGVATALPTDAAGTSEALSINIGGQSAAFSQAPSHVVIGGQTAAPGGPAIIVAGASISLPFPNAPADGSNLNPTLPPAPPLVYTIAEQAITANPTRMVVGESTIQAGGPAATVAGTPVSLQSSGALVIGGSTYPVVAAASPGLQISAPIYTVGDQPFTANPTEIAIAGTTITPGGVGATISGTPVILDSSGGLVIGQSTILVLPTAQNPASGADSASIPVLTVGNEIFTANPSAISIAGTTLTPGGAAVTIAGTYVALQPSGVLVIGGSTAPVAAAPTSAPVYTVGNQIFTANPTAISLAGTTITPNGSAVTIAGTPVSLRPEGSLVIGRSTVPVSPTSASIYTIGSQVFTANPTALSLAGTTITPGGSPITIAGTPINLQSSGILVIGSSTATLLPASTPAAPTLGTITSPSVFTVGGQTFTANSAAISLDGTIISPGGPGVTISGTPVSLETGGSLVVGSTTVAVGSGMETGTGTGTENGVGQTSPASTGQGNRQCGGGWLGIVAGAVVTIWSVNIKL